MAEQGWFNDAHDPRLARWFDGEVWTEHTLVKADWHGPGSPPPPVIEPDLVPAFAATSVLPIPPPPPGPSGTGTTSTGSTLSKAGARYKGWPLWARIALPAAAALLLIGAIGSGNHKKDAVATAGTTRTTSVDTSTSTSEDTTTTVEVTTVVASVATDAPTTTVAARTTVATAVTVAPTTTRAPVTTKAPTPTAPPATAPPTTAAPVSNCDPNYSGCLNPNSADYDCAGGGGNGPDFTGPVEVLGNDHYGLDGNDHDGHACENS